MSQAIIILALSIVHIYIRIHTHIYNIYIYKSSAHDAFHGKPVPRGASSPVGARIGGHRLAGLKFKDEREHSLFPCLMSFRRPTSCGAIDDVQVECFLLVECQNVSSSSSSLYLIVDDCLFQSFIYIEGNFG